MRMLICGVLLAASAVAELRIGAATSVITPDLEKHAPVYLAGCGQDRRATGIHDELFARCMAFSAGSRPLVICGVDSIGLFWDDVLKIRALVKGDVIVTATHNHETPDTMGLWGPGPGQTGVNEAYNSFVITRTAEAANAAIAALQPARIRLARIKSPELDSFVDDGRPPVLGDGELVALLAETQRGKGIGVLVNWNNHPEALASKNTLITADYLAAFHPVLEKRFGGVSVFCNGAVGGMQSPLGAKVRDPATGENAKEGTFRFAELIGLRVGEIAASALAGAKPAEVSGIVFAETVIDVPMANPGFLAAAKAGVFAGRKQPKPDGMAATPVGYVRFDSPRKGSPVLEIALIPGEMYPELSVGGIERYAGADFPDAPLEPPIKQQMTAPFRMLFGLANDEIGYIIPKAEWDVQPPWLQNSPKRWYGEVNSIGPDAAPLVNGAFAELVRKMR